MSRVQTASYWRQPQPASLSPALEHQEEGRQQPDHLQTHQPGPGAANLSECPEQVPQQIRVLPTKHNSKGRGTCLVWTALQ